MKRAFCCLACLLYCCMIPSCGSGGSNPSPDAGPAPVSVDDPYELQRPDAVDPGTWRELQEALAAELAKPGVRHTAAVPTGSRARVWVEFEQGDPDRPLISWHYANPGDYNQDGLVSISDLTPLGVRFGEKADPLPGGILASIDDGVPTVPFGYTRSASVVDGDGNGEIGIADVTTIGQGFNGIVEGYNIYAGTDISDFPAGASAPSTLQPIGSVLFSDAIGDASQFRRSFEFELPVEELGKSYWVRPFSGGSEGTPSRIAGETLQGGSGELSLSGIEPAAAQPGEIVRLRFSDPLPDDLSGYTVLLDGELELPLGMLAVVDDRADFCAPVIPPATVSIEVMDGAMLLGSTQLEITAGNPTITVEGLIERYDAASLALCEIFEMLKPVITLDPQISEEDFQSAIDEMGLALGLIVELIEETLADASEDERIAALCFMENSGSLDFLDILSETSKELSSKSVSEISEPNYRMLELDLFTALIDNSSVIIDSAAIAATVTSAGTGAPVAYVTKMIITILKGFIETGIATDLMEIRLKSNSPNRSLEAGESYKFEIEGKFCSEKNLLEGTIEAMVEAAIAGLTLPDGAKQTLVNAIKDELASKLGGTFTKAILEGAVSQVTESADPCFLHAGPYWYSLDLPLYSDDGWLPILSKFKNYGLSNWIEDYRTDTIPVDNVKFQTGPGEVDISLYTEDRIKFDVDGRHVVEVNAFRFEKSFSLLLWNWQAPKKVSKKIPYWVGRHGDWLSEEVYDDERSLTGLFQLQTADGPMVFFETRTDENLYVGYILPESQGWSANYAFIGGPNDRVRTIGLIDDRAAVHIELSPSGVEELIKYNGSFWSNVGVPLDIPGSSVRTFFDSEGKPGYIVRGAFPPGYSSYGVTEDLDNEGEWLVEPLDVTTPGSQYTAGPYNGNYQILREFSGKPGWVAIGIEEETGSIFFKSATNAAGTQWAPRVLINDNVFSLEFFAEIDGVPGVLFTDRQYIEESAGQIRQDDVLMYSRASSTDGSAWGGPFEVARIIDSGSIQFSGAKAIAFGGKPVIITGGLPGGLCFIEARDSSGSDWNDPVPIAYNAGGSNLVVLNGEISILYYNLDSDKPGFRNIFLAQPDLPPLDLD